MSFKILGTGSFLPKRSVSNAEMSLLVDTSDEWISQRVGVRERRVSTVETAEDMACGAAAEALMMSGTQPSELDMIICATVSADNAAPTLACSVQARLGASCPAMDVGAACSGFIYMLDTAAGFFARKRAEKILVIGAERLSRLVDWSDRNTCVIFGDGAGAMVLGTGDSYLASKLFAKGNNSVISIPMYGGASPFYKNAPRRPYIYMNGQETFKFAVNAMCTDLTEVVAEAGLTMEDISWVIPHQANIRIIDAAVKKLGMRKEKCLKNIDRVGNTSAASIPILFDESNRAGIFKEGEYAALCSFGGGLTSAACVLKL